MKAVILCAGEGLRLRPFTYSEPKVMIPVGNKPIVQYVVEALARNGMREIVMVVGYKKERIMSYFEDGKDFGVDIEYTVQKKQLGTAHALTSARELLRDDFVILPGDNIIDSKAVSDLMAQKKANSVLITESAQPSKYGVVVLSEGIIKQIVEKPEQNISNLISTGIYHLSPGIFKYIDSNVKDGKYTMTAALQQMALDENVHGVFTSGVWSDAIFPWDLLDLNTVALNQAHEKVSGTVEKDVFIKGTVNIGADTVIRSGTYIVGPVSIGSGCDIGPNVCINPSTSIGDNVAVEPFSLIGNSILMSDCALGPHSHVTHSVIGSGVRASSHFTTNVGEAVIEIEGELHKVPKIGVLIGEDSVLDSTVTALPGAVVGAKSRISALKVIRGVIPNESIVV